MMNDKPRLILLGGFLGSGKTTLMSTLGELLAARGNKVAVLTNDQGEFLVDTAWAKSRGMEAGEITGGCFCCNFGELVEAVTGLSRDSRPDFILAEPVGSCTDLAATVLSPMKLYHDELVSLGPYVVLADGPRFSDEYRNLNLEDPVSPREVLVSHQLKEASRIVVSKTDLLSERQISETEERIRNLVPGVEILPVSVPERRGLEELAEWVTDPAAAVLPAAVDIDYDVYAEAEAELGWYNGIIGMESDSPFTPDDVASDVILSLKAALGVNAAHAKLLLTTRQGSLKMSLAGGRIGADAASGTGADETEAQLILNIRALDSPENLESLARKVCRDAFEPRGIRETAYTSRALIPGAPKPTHRIS